MWYRVGMSTTKLTGSDLLKAYDRHSNRVLIQDLVREYGVSRKTLTSGWYNRLKLKRLPRFNPAKGKRAYDTVALHTRYRAGERLIELAKESGVTAGTLLTAFHQEGLPAFPACRRPVTECKILHAFIPELTPEGAYLLGLLMSDGCMLKHAGKYRTTYSLSFCSQEADKPHFEALAKKRYGTVYHYANRPQSIYFKTPSSSDLKELCRYGMDKKKAGRLTLPKEVEGSLFWPFFLGYFDGDGSFSSCGKSERQLVVYSIDRSFLSALKRQLLARSIASRLYTTRVKAHYILGRHTKECIMHSLRVIRVSDLQSIVQELLDPRVSVFGLERKQTKMQQWLQYRAKMTATKQSSSVTRSG